jgi:AraC-like DNA-binding protein
VAAGPGEGIAFLGAEPVIAKVSNIEALNLAVPRSALTPLVADVASKTMQVIPFGCEALRLLARYAEILREDTAPTTPEARHLLATHFCDLIAMALGATRSGVEIAESRGIRAARLRSVKADILSHLGDLSLSVEAVALRQRMTPRYVHMLFESEPLTFSQFVLENRLIQAVRVLTDRRFDHMNISSIAFEVGFRDLSYFNRAFRRRFSGTPSEFRCGIARG